jgi:hypothetical protein
MGPKTDHGIGGGNGRLEQPLQQSPRWVAHETGAKAGSMSGSLSGADVMTVLEF